MSKTVRIDELLQEAGEALAAKRYFEAERLAGRALDTAHKSKDYERMIAAVDPLLDARQERLDLAFEVGTLTRITEAVSEDTVVEPGCYLVEPPFVGADGRRLSVAALQQEVPIAVLCREPQTRLGLWPVVVICPGLTMRTKVHPPDNPDEPDLQWIAQSLLDLGDWGLAMLDPSLPISRRVDALVQRVDALPEHQGIHEMLVEACRQALAEAAGV